MNKAVILLVIPVLMLVGCHLDSSKPPTQPAQKSTKVIIEGDPSFVNEIAGTWRCTDEKTGWVITINDQGDITSIIHSLGRVELKPGQATTVKMRNKHNSVFEPGQWIAQYDGDLRTIALEVSIEHFYAEAGGGSIEGSIRDEFIGTVSEDGLTWEADWLSYPDYYANTDQQKNFYMGVDPNWVMPHAITFQKENAY